MTEKGAEYGLPPKSESDQKKVNKLFKKARSRLNNLSSDNPQDRVEIEAEIRALMDRLAILHVELPCQGVRFKGVVIDRDSEVPQETPPAPFTEWGKALGVLPETFEGN